MALRSRPGYPARWPAYHFAAHIRTGPNRRRTRYRPPGALVGRRSSVLIWGLRSLPGTAIRLAAFFRRDQSGNTPRVTGRILPDWIRDAPTEDGSSLLRRSGGRRLWGPDPRKNDGLSRTNTLAFFHGDALIGLNVRDCILLAARPENLQAHRLPSFPFA
jgi:hypothetical protein